MVVPVRRFRSNKHSLLAILLSGSVLASPLHATAQQRGTLTSIAAIDPASAQHLAVVIDLPVARTQDLPDTLIRVSARNTGPYVIAYGDPEEPWQRVTLTITDSNGNLVERSTGAGCPTADILRRPPHVIPPMSSHIFKHSVDDGLFPLRCFGFTKNVVPGTYVVKGAFDSSFSEFSDMSRMHLSYITMNPIATNSLTLLVEGTSSSGVAAR